MRVSWEATLTSLAEGVLDLEPNEVATYQALKTKDEKDQFLIDLIKSIARDEIHFTSVDYVDFVTREDDE